MKEIRPLSSIDATVRIPGSKSITHRAVIASGLASGQSVLKSFLECEDTLYTASVLGELGVDVRIKGEDLEVVGTGGRLISAPTKRDLYLGNSGTSFRLLLSVVALSGGEFLMTGSQRMLERPIGSLVDALNRLGVKATCVEQKDCPPVLVKADGIRGGRVSIPGDQSSQFISSLLLCGPYAKTDIEITVTGELVSKPYVDITIDVMEEFGARVDRSGYNYFRVLSGRPYEAREFTVQGDASSASYFWAAAAVTGGIVCTENIYPYTTRQGDIRFLELLETMGCAVEKKPDRVVVRGGRLAGIEADMSSMPDLVPTLAAVALFADGKTVIRDVPHLRHKESDRLQAVRMEWERLGGRVEELPDGLIIHGGGRLAGVPVDPHNDHRLAMSLAVVGLRAKGTKIKDEDCVKKSFPPFWELWGRMGALSP